MLNSSRILNITVFRIFSYSFYIIYISGYMIQMMLIRYYNLSLPLNAASRHTAGIPTAVE